MKEEMKFVKAEGFEFMAEKLEVKGCPEYEGSENPGIAYNISYEHKHDRREEREIQRKSKKEKMLEAEIASLQKSYEEETCQMLSQIKKQEEKVSALNEHNRVQEIVMRDMKENLRKEVELNNMQHRIMESSLEERIKSLVEDNEILNLKCNELKEKNENIIGMNNLIQKNTVDLESIIEQELQMKFSLKDKIELLQREKKSLENNCNNLMKNLEQEILKTNEKHSEQKKELYEKIESLEQGKQLLQKTNLKSKSKADHMLAVQDGLKLQIKKFKKVISSLEERILTQDMEHIKITNAFRQEMENHIEEKKILYKSNETLKYKVEDLEHEIENNSRLKASMNSEKQLEIEIQELEKRYDKLLEANKESASIFKQKILLEEKLNIALAYNNELQDAMKEKNTKQEQAALELKRLQEILEEFRMENDILCKNKEQARMFYNRKQGLFLFYIVATIAFFVNYYF